MSGLFKGSQMNWACLTKEAYAIYMSIKKLAYYLEDADVTLRSDHLPLKKFLVKNTLNSCYGLFSPLRDKCDAEVMFCLLYGYGTDLMQY